MKQPDDWKKGYVKPIYESGNRNLVNNYRPVTLILILSKVTESVVRDTVF